MFRPSRFFVFSVICVSILLAPIWGFADSSRKILDNGLVVIVSPMPSNPMVSVYGLIKAGGATEGKYLGSGLSHFLEHMLFKGTEHRAVGEIGKTIQSVGGSINAQTSFDYTMFTITVPVQAFDTAVEILADALFHSTLDPVELEKERKVIFGEMRMRKDNPDVRLNDIMFQYAYSIHPYKYPIIGYPELLERVTRDDLMDYYKTNYIPNNMVISIAGGVDASIAHEKVRNVFVGYPRGTPVVRNLPLEPEMVSPRFYEEFYPTDLTRLSLLFPSVSLLDSDLFALDVLAKILGQGASSILYRDLYREQELVYSVSAYNYTPQDKGIFVIEATLDDAKKDQVIRAVWENIEYLQRHGIKSKDLQKAKRQVESEYVKGRQTTESVAYGQAMDESVTGDYEFSRKYVDGVRSVSVDDIRRVARKYLLKNRAVISVLRAGTEHAKEAAAGSVVVKPSIEKIVLQNGLTVLLREDHTFPLVDIALAVQGGLRQEPEGLNGISALTANVWMKGTKKRTAEDLAQDVDSLGMSFDQFSGRNSIGLRMSFLSEDLDRGFELLGDVLKNPLFAEEEISKAKQLLLARIRENQDSIFSYTTSHLKKILFAGHPYRFDEEGTPESLEKIQRQDILDFYKRWVVPQNMVLSVYGDISREQIIKDIEKHFGSLPQKDFDLSEHVVTPIGSPVEETIHMDKEQALVLFAFQGPSLFSADYYGVDVLSAVLGSSFSGRLFNRVRDELGKAYTVGGNYYPGLEAGEIFFYVLTTADHADKVKDVIAEEIRRVQTDPVSPDELQGIKNYLKGGHRSSQQTNGSLSFMTSLDELYGAGYSRFELFENAIDQVSSEDIMRLAVQYLDLDKRVVVVTLPNKKEDE